MKNMKKETPQGIELLCYIYILNVVFFIASLLLFENRVLLLGRPANTVLSWFIKAGFAAIPVYLTFRLIALKKDGLIAAILFHICFVINNVTSFLESLGMGHTLVRVTGLYGSAVYSPSQIFVIFLNTLLNLFILFYLFSKKRYYF